MTAQVPSGSTASCGAQELWIHDTRGPCFRLSSAASGAARPRLIRRGRPSDGFGTHVREGDLCTYAKSVPFPLSAQRGAGRIARSGEMTAAGLTSPRRGPVGCSEDRGLRSWECRSMMLRTAWVPQSSAEVRAARSEERDGPSSFDGTENGPRTVRIGVTFARALVTRSGQRPRNDGSRSDQPGSPGRHDPTKSTFVTILVPRIPASASG
jgi:hypothetical protein